MNMKIKCLFLILLHLHLSESFGFTDNYCPPCFCEEKYFNDVNNVDNGWIWQRKNGKGNSFLMFACGFPGSPMVKAKAIPSYVPKNIEVLWFAGESVCKNGLKKELFERFTSVEELVIQTCGAQTVDINLVYPQRNILKELYIIENGQLTDIPVGTFQKAPLLWGISVHSNSLVKINNGLFSNMKMLRWIKLNNNKIDMIEVGAFQNTPSLNWVDIGSNKLTYVDVNIFAVYKIYKHGKTTLGRNPWVCNEELCPLMHHAKENTPCKEPFILKDKGFGAAIKYVGLKVDRRRHQVDLYDSVQMQCSSCDYTKLSWQKEGGDLPSDVSLKQAQGSRKSVLKIQQVKEEHTGNYTCFNPACTEADCPKPVISLTLNLIEPNWNFTEGEGAIDESVRYGGRGLMYGLIPLSIYAITMAICMSAYWIFIQEKKNRAAQAQEPQPEGQP